MQQRENSKTPFEQKKFTPSDTWERLGITEHQGGTYATQRLIELCRITPGQYVLDVGCGTGYTACLLARKYQVDVVAVDVSSKILEQAKRRITEQEVGARVTTVQADVHELPFQANTFDAVIAESVLVHVREQKKVFSEAYRVLETNGVFGDNELTCSKPPPKQLHAFLSASLGIATQPLQEDEWRALFGEAGFVDISSTVYTIDPLETFRSHLQVDGVRRYIAALSQGIFDPTLRGTFFKKDMLKAALQFSSYVGYGLYVGRKV